MTITPELISPSDVSLGRRVLVRARMIAPCLNSLTGDALEDAVAILQGVIAEVPESGSRNVRSMSRNGTSVTFDAVASAFSDEDSAALRSLCGVATYGAPPVGSFPRSVGIRGQWPEGEYS